MSDPSTAEPSTVDTAPPLGGRATRVQGALAGTVAAAMALAAGELVTLFDESFQSLVISVDNIVVDETPGDLAKWLIDRFGTNDKPILITTTVLLALAFGALLGRAAARRWWVGAVGFGTFGVLGAWAGMTDPLADGGGSLLAALVATGAGIGTLYLLLAVADGSLGAGLSLASVSSEARRADPSLQDPRDPRHSRRAFFGWAGAATVLAAGTAGLSRALKGPSRAVEQRELLLAEDAAAGRTADVLRPGLAGDIDGLSPLITPNADFYRIDTALRTPQVDIADWRLRITGMVDEELELGYAELTDLADFDADVTLSCVSNEVGGDLVGNARWEGVELADLLDMAGVRDGATQIVGRSVDGWTAGFPTEIAFDGRPALLALRMNGEPLPIPHGFPARLVVSGLYGYVSATKWISEIELTTWEDFDGYWVPRGWAKEGPIKTQSRIDVPRRDARLVSGRQPIAGVAWAGIRSVDRVEVQVDDGEWMDATLGEELAETSWRQWFVEWEASPGRHLIRVRATDGDGATQTDERMRPAPDGATGWHTIAVDVT